MATIAICDDDIHICRIVFEHVKTYQKLRNTKYQFHHYLNTSDLMKHLSEISVLILDIEIGDENGLEFAKRIRALGNTIPIIILSAYPQYLPHGYKINALRFLLKPLNNTDFTEALDTALDQSNTMPKVEFTSDRTRFQVSQENILYISSRNKGSEVWVKNQAYPTTENLLYWKSILNPDFFYPCHKSYLVNVKAISYIKKNQAHLITGDIVPVSRRNLTELQKQLFRFLSF